MKTYIALFRGINVGGNNILPMKDLVKILEGIGFTDVKTYIQSGNVVFKIDPINTKTVAKEISGKILKKFGFEPTLILLEKNEFRKIADKSPFRTSEGKTLHIFFLESEPRNPDLKSLNEVKSSTEEFKLLHNVFYLYAPDGIGRSKLAAVVEKKLGVPSTGRNWNTVSKLIELAEQ